MNTIFDNLIGAGVSLLVLYLSARKLRSMLAMRQLNHRRLVYWTLNDVMAIMTWRDYNKYAVDCWINYWRASHSSGVVDGYLGINGLKERWSPSAPVLIISVKDRKLVRNLVYYYHATLEHVEFCIPHAEDKWVHLAKSDDISEKGKIRVLNEFCERIGLTNDKQTLDSDVMVKL